MIFWTKFTGKGYFLFKVGQANITIKFSLFELVYILKFILNNFDFSDQICSKRVFPVQSSTNKHYHRIQHIEIRVGTNFHRKQTILKFMTKIALEVYFWPKSEKVNVTIKFIIFELIYNPGQNYWNSTRKSCSSLPPLTKLSSEASRPHNIVMWGECENFCCLWTGLWKKWGEFQLALTKIVW